MTSEVLGYSVWGIAGIIILFIVLREVINWYYKVNERITLMKETNHLLKMLVKNTTSTDGDSDTKDKDSSKTLVMTEEQKKTYENIVKESK